ncbi:hypothetical protein AAG570_003561 [Ranatra chinensis]|uniref:Uncharacterized protein n=1 Tax=Ranatra chinensis TaxID=642074 RepID=A0ABD0Y3Z6_9HEMI
MMLDRNHGGNWSSTVRKYGQLKHSEALRTRLGVKGPTSRESIRRWSSLHNPKERRQSRARTYSDSGGAVAAAAASPGRSLSRVHALRAESLSPPPLSHFPRRRFSYDTNNSRELYCYYPQSLKAEDGVQAPKHVIPDLEAGDDGNSFGKRTGGSARRPNECFVLEPSEMIVSKTLRTILNAPWYVSNHTLHTDLNIPTV